MFCHASVNRFYDPNQRQEQGDDDAAYDYSQEDNHDRLQQRGHGARSILDFFITVVGDFREHLGQCARLLSDIDHAGDHHWENARALQCRCDGFPLLNVLMHFGDNVGDEHVPCRLFYNRQCLENRHTVAGQGCQGS